MLPASVGRAAEGDRAAYVAADCYRAAEASWRREPADRIDTPHVRGGAYIASQPHGQDGAAGWRGDAGEVATRRRRITC